MLTVTRRFTFDAAHCLRKHKGKCQRYHGHTYILEVTVCGGPDARTVWEDQGFFLDLGDLKSIVNSELDAHWDHHDLNKTVDVYPTAERLIHVMWAKLQTELRHRHCELITLRLHETQDSWVEYDGHDPIYSHVGVQVRDEDPDPQLEFVYGR